MAVFTAVYPLSEEIEVDVSGLEGSTITVLVSARHCRVDANGTRYTLGSLASG
jgi:hypothetical protein